MIPARAIHQDAIKMATPREEDGCNKPQQLKFGTGCSMKP